MTRGIAAATLVVAALVPALAGCSDTGSDDSPEAFCAAVTSLREQDPFADLAVATPEEMRDAFAELQDAGDEIARTAPDEVRVQAERYSRTVSDLRDELAGAGYDARRLDTLRYSTATDAYTAAADSLDNAADALCG